MKTEAQKYQRVAKKDAEVILEKLIKNFKYPHMNPVESVENFTGGSNEFISRHIVDELIEKLCR